MALVGRGSLEKGKSLTDAAELEGLTTGAFTVGFAGAAVGFGFGCDWSPGLTPFVGFEGGTFGGGFAGLALILIFAAGTIS